MLFGASDVVEQFFGCEETQAASFVHLRAGGKRTGEEDWDDERMAVPSVEALGVENPSTPRNGPRARASSGSPRRTRDKRERKNGGEWTPVR